MGLTNIGEQVLLNRLFTGVASGTINALLDGTQEYKLALYTAFTDLENPAGGTTTECTGSAGTGSPAGPAYSAQVVAFTPALAEATGTGSNTVDLSATVEFTDDAGSDWGIISHYGIHVGATGFTVANSNCIFAAAWSSSATVNSGDTVQVAAGGGGLAITAN